MGGIGETDGLTRRCLAWCSAVAQPEARRHFPLGLEAGEPDLRSAALAAPRRSEVLQCLGRVHARALEDVAGQFVAPNEVPRPVFIDRRVVRLPVLPGVEFVDEREGCPGERWGRRLARLAFIS